MSKKNILLASFTAAKFLLQYFLFNNDYDLHRDEYLYLDQGNHLAWGYVSVPPVTSWISWIILKLGKSLFWVRFFPAFFGALTMLFVWKTIEQLRGNLFALILGGTCMLFSVFLRLNQLYQPNSIDVLSWVVFYFTVIKYIDTEKTKWIYAAAVVLAIGFLNKYNIVFALIGLVPAVLISEHRRVFLKREVLGALVLGLLLISPNLIWQFQNHFPVIRHMRELSETQLVNVSRWNFLKDQAFYFAGSLLVIIAGVLALLLYPAFRTYRLFVWAMFFTLAIFIFLKAKSYYSIGLYPIYIAFGAVFLGEYLNDGWKKYLRPAVIVIPIVIYMLCFNLFFSLKSPSYILAHSAQYKAFGMLRWEDGKDHALPQDFADMLGWKELGGKVDSLCASLPQKERTLILCDNYGQAGAVNYYGPHVKIAAVSFNADYMNWFDLTQPYDNLIRIKTYEENDDELHTTGPFFESAAVAGSVTNAQAREFGTHIYIFGNAKIDIRNRIQLEIDENR